MRYRPDIDGLRTVAVIPVVLFHIMASLIPGGFVGVDIFFVISGYLIGGILWKEVQEDRLSIVTFYERRIRRIFPALFATLALTYVIAYFLYMPIDFRNLSASLASAILFCSNIFFWWNTGYFDLSATFKPLLHTWSLAVEEQYYTLFPLLLFFLYRYFRRWLVPILCALILISFVTSVIQVMRWPQAAFYLPFGRFWELLIGALVAIGGWRPPASQVARNAIAGVGLALIAVSLAWYTEETPFPGVAALLPTVGTVLIIYAGEHGLNLVGRFLSLRPMIFIGKISYSLYLVHWPIMAFFRYSMGREPGGLEVVTLFVFMIFVAWLSYYFVERPFREGRLRRISHRPLFAGAAATGLVLVAFGGVAYSLNGMPQRFDAETRNIALAAYDTNPLRATCDQRKPEKVRVGAYCIEGNGKAQEPTFAFVGDSFADSLSPGIIKAAKQAGEKGLILTYSGCYPLLGLKQRGECRSFMDAAAAEIEKQKSVRTIVLVARWTSAYLGTRFGEKNEEGWFLTDDQSTEKSYPETKRVFERALTRTLDRFKGYRIIVLYGFPEQDRNIPRALGVASALHKAPFPGIARTVHDERQAPVRDVFARFGTRYDFKSYDATDQFCDDDHCRITEGSVVLYADDNHLSKTGAESLVDFLGQIFTRRGGALISEQDL